MKTALVTGASRGMGAAVCRKLVEDGLRVHGLARNGTALAELKAELGQAFTYTVCDVTDPAATRAALAGLEIDVLVNNAGKVTSVRPLVEQDETEIAESITLNLVAPLTLARGLLPSMIARGGGHIINITSTVVHGALGGTVLYSAAKAGLSHASTVLRYELAGSNVRVTDIAPGRTETEFYLDSHGGDREGLKSKMYTEHRPLRAADIASAVSWAIAMPEHADIASIIISPTDQALGGSVYATRNRQGAA